MNKNIISFSSLAAAAVVILPSAGCSEHLPQKPNVIIILSDDLGYGDLECYGSGVVSTPNVNKLAEQGILFTNAHSTSSTSTPSRYGMLTGVYPWRQGGTEVAPGDAGMIINPDKYTFADVAKSAGYATGAIGKWHLGLGEYAKQEWNGLISPNLSNIGFDYSYIMAATGDRVPCVFIENGRVDNWDSLSPIYVSYNKNFPGEPTGKDNPELLTKLRPSPNHGHDMSIVNGISRIGFMKGGGKALWRDEDIADKITNKALNFIELNRDKPFFLYFGTNDIHVPRVPNERFVGKSGLGVRGDAILEFDYSVGAVMDKLVELGIADNTIVLLTSDNGPVIDDGYADKAVQLLGDHNPMGLYRGGKYSSFEAGTRVPMIIRWPAAIKNGQKSDAPVSQIDYMSTVGALIGGMIPSDADIDSRNAISTFTGRDKKGREYIIEQTGSVISILYRNWKFIPASNGPRYGELTNTEYGNTPVDKLYDLSYDHGEKINVAKHHPEIIKRLKKLLNNELEKGNSYNLKY